MRDLCLRCLFAVSVLVGSCSAFSPNRCPLPIQSYEALHRRPAVRAIADADSKTKITIRTPAEKAATEASGAKVTVRVRTPSETATAAPPLAEIEDDSASTTKVTIKAPAKSMAPPPAPAPDTPPLSDAEKDLLEATQRANSTLILAALQAGANPNVRDPKGRTPLHFVSGLGLAPAAMLLLHFGAVVDVRDEGGLTPLHMAAGYANAQTLRVLVAAGADATIKGDQGTPVEIICARGDYQLSQLAQKNGFEKRLKKKDELLERLKACMDVLDDVEATKAEADWDEMLTEVMKTISPV